ncbi:MAG: serine/threonine-protein kinase [Pseudomonadota bacterium]
MSAKPRLMEDGNDPTFADELPNGTLLLGGQYRIERFLNAGGFGITYLARDSLDRIVVIKECYPSSMCVRSNKTVRVRSRGHAEEFDSIVRLFGQEARALAKLDHPHIVGVHQVFEDNHTAYMALDFVQGQDLLDVIEHEPRRLQPDAVVDMLRKLLDAVDYIHSHDILHRDISPDNILLTKENEPVLIDFGAAREQATRASRLLSQLHMVKDGYSPQEFYVQGAKQTTSADLYALGATFFHVITGEAPPVSQQRLAAVAEKREDPYIHLNDGSFPDYDPYFLGAIDEALQVFPNDRLQTAQEWIDAIDTDRRRSAALARASEDKAMEDAILKIAAETNEALRREEAHEQKMKKRVRSRDARGGELPDYNGSGADQVNTSLEGKTSPRKSLFGRVFNVSLWRLTEREKANKDYARKAER